MATKQFLTDADFEDAAPLKPVQTGVLGRAGDLGLSVLKGTMAVPEFLVGVANIPTGGKAGKAVEEAGVRFKDAKQILDDQMSVAGQLAQRKYERAEGFTGKVGAAIQNPSIISSGIAESAGPMGAGMAVGRGLMAVAPRVIGGLAGAIGEGVVGAGSAAEQIRQQTADGELTGKQAALAGATGLATTAFGALGNKIGNKLGVGDIDNALIGGAASQAPAKQAGLAKRVAGGAFSEGVLEELPQSVSEQMLQNVALDRDPMQGVDSAAAMGLVTGGAMGAGFGILNRAKAPAAAPEQATGGAQPGQTTPTGSAGPTIDAPAAHPALGQSLTGTPMADLMGGSGLTGGANPLQAGLSTLTSNNQMYPGINTEPTGYTVDPETGAIIQADPVGARQMAEPVAQVEVPAPAAQAPVAPAPVAPALGESLTGTPVADMLDTRTPSQRMGLNPESGGLTAAAAIAVDSGASPATAGMGFRALSGAAPAAQPVSEQATQQQQAQPPAQQPILNNGKPFTLAEVGQANQAIGGTAVSVPGGWAIQPPATVQQPAATPATAMPTAATPAASAQSAILGRNSQPIAEGGQPFFTREEAKAEKRLQPLMRVAPAEGGGFILKPASERQLAAVEKAAKRLKYPSTGETGPRSLHGFILQIGGLASGTMPDIGFDLNPRVGNRRLFSPRGKTIEQAAMAAKQEGYIQDEDENTLIEALKRSLNVSPVYTPDGYEAMAEAQMQARYEDFLAAEQDGGAENDWSRLTPEELAETGYNDYDEATQAEIRALVAQAEALGIDAESILEDVAQRTENATQKDYENAAKSAIEAAIEAAIRSSEESRSRDLGQAGAEAGSATADTQAAPAAVTGPASDVRARNLAALKARMMGQKKPTPTTPPAQTKATPAPEAGPTNQGATNGQGQETLLKAEQPTDAAAMVSGAPVAEQPSDTTKPGGFTENVRKKAGKVDAAPAQPILTSPTKADIEAQQARAEQAAKAKAAQSKADAARAAKERERKDIAAASVAAADTFELGGDAMSNLTGQQDVFGAMEQAAQPTPPKATELTPKQFHEAKLAFIAADTASKATATSASPAAPDGNMPAPIASKKTYSALLPFNIQGNKTQLLANGMDSFLRNAVKGARRVIDAFGGAAAYTHALAHNGDLPSGSIYNEFEPLRYITNKQIKENVEQVIARLEFHIGKINAIIDQAKNSPTVARKLTADYVINGINSHKLDGAPEHAKSLESPPSNMADSPDLAALYLIAQNSRFGFRPIQSDVGQDGRINVMSEGENDLVSITKDGAKITLFGRGKTKIIDSANNLRAASKRLQGVDVRMGDGWMIGAKDASAGDVLLVDTSYLNKKNEDTGKTTKTANYNKATQEDAIPDVYKKKVTENLLPAWDRGAKIVITNNWNDDVAAYLENLGFTVIQDQRAKGVSNDTRELIAINFNQRTGEVVRRRSAVSDGTAGRVGESTERRGNVPPGQDGLRGLAAGAEGQNGTVPRSGTGRLNPSTGAGKADARNAALTSVVRNGGNSTAVLTDIAKNSTNPAFKLVAKAILAKGLPFDLRIRTDFTDGKVAHYSTDGHFVEFDPGMPFNLEQVLLHEAVHAVTSKYVASFGDSTPLGKELAALFKLAEQHAKKTGAKFYGLTSADEFLSEVMTNADFAQWLDTVPVPLQKSALSRFVRAVARFFGIQKADGATAQAMDVFERIMLAQSDLQAEASQKLSASKDAAAVAQAYGVDTEEDGDTVYFGDAEVSLNREDNTYIVTSENEFTPDHRAAVAWAENNGFTSELAKSPSSKLTPVESMLRDALEATGDMGAAKDMAYEALRRQGVAVKWQEVVDAAKKMGRTVAFGSDDGLMFSRAAAKEVRDLVTLHNLSEDNLMYAGKMGGIPVPSIGITKVETPFGGFGGITLIAQKDLIDPESGVPVYDRDAWTARFPKLNFKKVKAKVADAFYERMQSVRDFGSDGGQFMSMLFEELRNSNVQAPDKITSLFTRYTAPKMLYAQEVLGKTIKPPMRDIKSETPFGHAKSWRDFVAKNYKAGMTEQQEKEFNRLAAVAARAAMAEINTENKARVDERTARMLDSSMNGYLDRYISENYGMNAGILDRAVRDVKSFGKKEVDPMKLDEAVRKVVPTDDAGYTKWISNLVEPLFEAPTITLRGAEVPVTLDNIVDAMTIGKTAGAEKSMTFGAGKAASMLGKQFKSIDEIKAARDRVVSTASESEGKKSTEALISEYQNHVSEFYTGKDWKGNIDTWAALDSSLEALTKSGRTPTDASMNIALQRAGFKRVDAKGISLAKQALEALRDASTNYFEAKPQRAVRLNEFKGAVVPKGTSAEAIALLEENGITVEVHGNAEGAREKAIQKLAKKLDGKTGNVIFSRDTESPRTPAATIRAAITKAYGNLLDKLEAKGLVTIAQTEREAIEAAAQARADKTGGDVEQIKRSMLASVQASRGTISGMPETKAPGPQGDAKQGAVQGNSVINAGIDFVSEIERLSEKHGRVYIRWSPGAEGDMSGEQASRDFVSGATHAGLSAIEITDEMHPVVIAKRLSEYSFLRMQDRRSKPFVYLAERVGTDSDGYASIKPKNVLLESSPDVLKAIDAKLAEVMDAMDDVQRESDKLEKYPGHAAVMQRLDAAQARLAKLIPNEQSAPSSQGVDVKYSANGNIEGFFDKQTGKSFLVADNLTAASAPGTLMHEVGIHMAADGKMDALFKRAGSLLKTGTQNEFIQRVKARMARAGETSDEEAAAYIVTEYENDRAKAPITIGKWLADLTAAVRAWLFSKGIILKAEQLTVADIAAVARANARSMARGGSNGGPGGGQAFSRNVGDAAPDEAQRVQAAIEGKSLIEAAMFLTRSSNKANAAIAQKVAEKLKRMEAIGVDLNLHIVHRGDMAPAALANSRGYTESGFDSKGRDVAVWLNGADVDGKVGTEEEVLLHELVHAATTGMVHYGAMNPDTQAGRNMKDLMAVTDAIADHIKQRFADAETGKVTLTEFELDMREGANNAFRSDDEVLAWALSNAEAQQYLEGIPYKSGSLWSNFVRSVRALLGMSPEMDTALSEVLRVAERLLTDDQAKTGRSAFWHKRGLRMIQQQGRGSIVQTQMRSDPDIRFSRAADMAGNAIDKAKQTADKAMGKDFPRAASMPDLNDDQRSLLGKVGASQSPASDAIKAATDRAGLKIRQGMVDRFAALKELDEKALGQNFIADSITNSAWVLAKMSSAGSGALNAMMKAGRIEMDAQQKVIGLKGAPNGGLTASLQKLGGPAEVERFFAWMAANRAEKLMGEGRENLFTPAEIAAGKTLNTGTTEVGKVRPALYSQVHAEFQQYRDDVLAIAEQTGIINSDNRAMWRDEFYVPFYRVMEDDADRGRSGGNGLSRQEAYKKLKGGKQNLNDLMENTLMNFHHLLSASLKNQAAVQAIKNAETVGIARKVPEARRDTKTSTFVLVDGKKVFYEVDDPLVFESITTLADPGLNNTAVRVMGAFKRLFTNMTTATPQFIIANTFRDLLQASATSPTSKNIAKNLKEGIQSYRDEKTRAEMLASGGAFSFGHIYGMSADEVKESLQKTVAGAGLISSPSMIPSMMRKMWDAWSNITDLSENASRAATYTQNVEQMGKLRAAFEARDVMDFSQHGAWPAVRLLVRIVPFLNARLQGLDKLYRSGLKPSILTAMGKGTDTDKQAAARFAMVTGALTLATMALYLVNADDDEYKKLEEWQKDTYWFIRIGENAFFLPKPFEVGAIATMAERTLQQAMDDKATGKLFRERMWEMLMQTFAFNPTPQMFQPLVDVYANKDAFTGRDIESAGMERMSTGLRSRDTTTAPATALSAVSRVFGDESAVAVSPVQADHLIKGYLGGVGATAAGWIDTMYRAATGQSSPDKAWSEYQPIRRFYRDLDVPVANTRYTTLFYDGLKEANRAYADVMELQKLGRTEDAQALATEKRSVLQMRIALNAQQRRMTEINNRMKEVRRSDKDGEWKRRELDLLNTQKAMITERMGKRIEDARVQ